METYIALLRGIGGKYTLPMKELVRLLERMGLANVKTYIQSGNAVFQARKPAPAGLSGRISAAIDRGYGFAPQVILLKLPEFRKAAASNPYPEAESQPKSLHLFFLAAVPKRPDLAALDRLRTASERFTLKGKVFYLHAPDGVGRSKLFARIEKSLGVPATARNWRSVCNIKAMAEEIR